ncbi:MAG: hypothetical protein MJ212_06440, partial [Alphaproteobacteria bacterium]|nr:hypothetical protein [Alphaproteobacteria bacterium]
GINFGKESYASIPDNSTSVSFEYYAWNTKPYTQMTANLCDFEDGTRAKKIEGYHFYKDQDTKYNFMIVAKNRTVYVYFKEDGEDISKLGICRAVIPNVNTAGYVSIFGLNGISFDIFNYKLTNIAPEAKKDSAIALRESFNGENLSDKLAVDGNVNLKNKSLQLSGGNISTKNKSSYYIANFTVLKLNADLSVNFADNKSLILSNDLKKATLNDGGKKKTFDISEYKLSEYKNTQFQLILQYDALSLSAKGVYEPYDKFAYTIVEYTFAKPLSSGIFKLCSDNAFIDDMSVYALDNTYKATNVAYKDDPNDTNIWIAKDNVKNKKVKSVNSNKTDKIPTLYIIIYSVIGVVILALFGVIIAFSVKKRGKKQ